MEADRPLPPRRAPRPCYHRAPQIRRRRRRRRLQSKHCRSSQKMTTLSCFSRTRGGSPRHRREALVASSAWYLLLPRRPLLSPRRHVLSHATMMTMMMSPRQRVVCRGCYQRDYYYCCSEDGGALLDDCFFDGRDGLVAFSPHPRGGLFPGSLPLPRPRQSQRGLRTMPGTRLARSIWVQNWRQQIVVCHGRTSSTMI